MLHWSIARPASSPVVDNGVPKRAAGLPKTAAALILSANGVASEGAEPISPTVSPSGGTPASMSTVAAPWE